MTGKKLNEKLKLGAAHPLYREDGMWYHPLKKFPGILFDKNGYLIFLNKKVYEEHPLLQHAKDLHVVNGISNITGYIPYSIEEKRLVGDGFENTIDEETIRIIRNVEVIKRKKTLVDKLKRMYDNTCQICGERLAINKDVFYSEVHHIKPLGKPHNGPDKLENMICVCPNHHVLLDCFALTIDIKALHVVKHLIRTDFLEYYNSKVF